jgi:hypothetical protein
MKKKKDINMADLVTEKKTKITQDYDFIQEIGSGKPQLLNGSFQECLIGRLSEIFSRIGKFYKFRQGSANPKPKLHSENYAKAFSKKILLSSLLPKNFDPKTS